jgi:DUF1680 family protein
MKKTLLVLAIFSSIVLYGNKVPSHYAKNRHSVALSFTTPTYSLLPLGAIKPEGWLLDQLQIMRNGTSGHLDEEYAKLKDDNGWLGGRGDGGEETPYWLDGALPLAYLLGDKTLQSKVMKYVNWTLDHQRSSGYFGPITKAEWAKGIEITVKNCKDGEDWWPKMVMLKVLQQYYSATKDKRVILFMTRYFHYQLQTLKKCPLNTWSEWAEARGEENAMMVQWLYSVTHESFLLQLATLLESQSYPWSHWFADRNWVINAASNQNDVNWMHRHGVNVAMGLKDPIVNYQRTGNTNFLKDIKTGWKDLMSLHGLPMGMFSADEDLHGNLPTQGVELCVIVETMFSLENIIQFTGDPLYMDALERIAYNALPTQTTDDYNEKQYFQIANQVNVKRGVFNFSLPFDRGMNNVFGMRSGYTCCLANMHQGFPKFTQNLWYKTKNGGLAAFEYAPCQVSTEIRNHVPIIIKEQTNYPFDDKITFIISMRKAIAFSFQFRIPSWCKEATLSMNGKMLHTYKGDTIISIHQLWKNGDSITLKLPMEVTTSNWARNSRTIERGPLVYALKLGEKWVKGHDELEGDYDCVFPTSPWNYGILVSDVKNPMQNATVTIKPLSSHFIWNEAHAPIEIEIPAKKILGWKIDDDGVANQPVTDRNGLYKGLVSDSIEKIKLIPYGFTKVRVVAFPVVQ